MTQDLRLQFDHLGITRNESLFVPKISSSDENSPNENVVIVTLACRKDDLLKWSDSLQKAKQLSQESKLILWRLDLGIESQDRTIDEEVHFLSSKIAVDEFAKEVWPQFKHCTFGVALYQGDFSQPFLGRHDQEAFLNWLEEIYPENASKERFPTECLMRHFQAEKIMVYLRLLANHLPDDLLILLFLDFQEIISPSEQFHLFSKECFEYFLLAVKGSILPVEGLAWQYGRAKFGYIDFKTTPSYNPYNEKIGVIFPQEEKVDFNLFEDFDQIFKVLLDEEILFRILPEKRATHMWDTLDCLIVLKKTLNDQVQRVVNGFSAAGGRVVFLDKGISLQKELFQFKL